MIFICVGSREYQFDRLLKKIDELISDSIIQEEVYAQIGQSTYTPMNYRYERFLDSEAFKEAQSDANLIISHAGTGALMGALKLNKKVIAVPRLEKYGEHTDDHQLQIAGVLDRQNYLKEVIDMDDLGEAIKGIQKGSILLKHYDKPSGVLNIVDEFIERNI